MTAPDLSIITVGFNSRGFIKDLLTSLRDARGDLSIEYFIVDNTLGDGTLDMVREEFGSLQDERLVFHLIQNNSNLGFAAGNNIALAQARGRYVLLLNPDMRLFTNSLTNLVAWMDNNPTAGIVGGKLVGPGGELVPHVRRFPTLLDQVAILLKIPHVFPGVLNSYLAADFDYSRAARVDSIRGSFFAMRRSVIEQLGGLDERYFIWFEEVDYCKQAAVRGIEVWYTPDVACTDFVGQSFSLVSGYRKQQYFTNSMGAYFAKWHRPYAWVIQFVRPVALTAAWVYERFRLWRMSASN